MQSMTIDPGDTAVGLNYVGELIVLPGATVIKPTVTGTIIAHPGSRIFYADVDADGAMYGIVTSRHWSLGEPKSVRDFLNTRTIVDFPTVRGARNKALLLERTEVRGGNYSDMGNDFAATEGVGWVWIHGNLPDKPVRANRFGLKSLDPLGHSDGVQPFASHLLVEGDVYIDLKPFGPGYHEKGAGFFFKPDFGPLAPIYVRNGVHVRTVSGYGLRVDRDGGSGEYPGAPIVLSNITLERLDGKHPIDVPPYVQMHDVKNGSGEVIGRLP